MRSLKGWARIEFYCELPENDGDADTAFDQVCDAIDGVLNARTFPYVIEHSFSIADANTEPDE